jgi:hypothetical protein
VSIRVIAEGHADEDGDDADDGELPGVPTAALANAVTTRRVPRDGRLNERAVGRRAVIGSEHASSFIPRGEREMSVERTVYVDLTASAASANRRVV